MNSTKASEVNDYETLAARLADFQKRVENHELHSSKNAHKREREGVKEKKRFSHRQMCVHVQHTQQDQFNCTCLIHTHTNTLIASRV